jgi:hypothetical protein
MVLDRRLTKLASGLSSKDAARAFARSASGQAAALSAEERARAEEFEAIIEAMFLMAAVDGEIAEDEIAQLAGSLQAIVDTEALPPNASALTKKDLDRTLADLNARLAKAGWKARLDAVAARLKNKDARSFAFRLAAGVAFVDDHVAHAEAAAIDAFAAALGLTSDESQEILNEVQEALFAR